MDEIKKEVTPLLLRYICTDDCSAGKKEEHPIDAEEIVEAIKYGKKVEIINAVVKGAFILKSVNVEGEITIQGTTIEGLLDWSYTTFERVLNLENSTFKTDATFTESNFKKSINFYKSTFEGKSEFASTQIGCSANFNEAVFKKLASFNGAHIGGFAFFRSTIFEGEVDFVSARIGSDVEFTRAVFEDTAKFVGAHIEGSVTFAGAVFEKTANFNSSQIAGAASFKRITFEGEVDFTRVRIGSNAEFTGAMFEKLASFNSSQIDGTAFFGPEYLSSLDEIQRNAGGRLVEYLNQNFGIKKGKTVGNNNTSLTINDEKSKAILKSDVYGTYEFIVKTENGELNIYNPAATFKGRLDFIGARIGSANFNEAVFEKLVNFNKAHIKDSAFFKSATFEGEADFGYAQIGTNAEFVSTLFKGSAIFDSSQIEGKAIFDLTTFEDEVDFTSARIGSDAGFSGIVFREQAKFYGFLIEGSGFFNSAYLFSWDEILGDDNKKFIEFLKLNYAIGSVTPEIEKSDDGTTIKVTTKNNQIVATLNNEKSKVRLTTDNKTEEFITKTENNKLKIYKSTTFGGVADFTRARFGGDARFDGTIFDNNVSFKDTFFRTIYFGEPEVQFQAKIDLRGCIYDRIDPVSFWKQLMECLNPYDRQPFTQLEKTFRWAGSDKRADDVHYEQKSREFTENITIQKPGAWLLNRFLWLFTGYGVRLHRLLLAIVPILAIGTVIFQLEGAVRLDMQPHSMISIQTTISCWDAFWVSLNTFLPIEIQSGADWIPSSQIIPRLGLKFSTFATFLNLAGWILVPVGVAGISGLLKGSK